MIVVKRIAKSLIPNALKRPAFTALDEIVALREFVIDTWRYQRSSGARDSNALKNISGLNREAQVIKDYHRVEKGLALPSPKRPFGEAVKERLEFLVTGDGVGGDEHNLYAVEALDALRKWNSHGVVDPKISPLNDSSYVPPTRETLRTFFESRRSVRDFDIEKVPTDAILERAVVLAGNSPSVCNRQAWQIHFFRDPESVRGVLAHQNGNSGFRDTVPVVGLVSVKRSLFLGPAERNQRWIDGGLFAMSLVWALHGEGLSTCMLNWSMNNAESDKLRRFADIPSDEDIVVLIAIGHSSDGHRVARSPRRAADDLINWHDSK